MCVYIMDAVCVFICVCLRIKHVISQVLVCTLAVAGRQTAVLAEY